MKDEKGVFSRASRTEEIEKYGKRIFCKTRQGVISGNPGLREMDERNVSDGPSEDSFRCSAACNCCDLLSEFLTLHQQ